MERPVSSAIASGLLPSIGSEESGFLSKRLRSWEVREESPITGIDQRVSSLDIASPCRPCSDPPVKDQPNRRPLDVHLGGVLQIDETHLPATAVVQCILGLPWKLCKAP